MNDFNTQGINKNHNAILENRKRLLLSGVTDVDSFNENQMILFTELGELMIKGKNLHINEMNVETGDFSVEGDIWALIYGDKDKNQRLGILKKIFK